MQKQWHIFVEGNDDETFFQKVISPILEELYGYPPILIKFRQKTTEYIRNYIRNLKAIPWADYIFVVDLDVAPCFPAKKRQVAEQIKGIDEGKIIVVIREIESWYIAGLSEQGTKELKVNPPEITDDFTKEDLEAIITRKRESSLNFRLELLKYFCDEKARRRNASYKYFVEKYLGKTKLSEKEN